MDKKRKNRLLKFCEVNDIIFTDLNVLNKALTHSSYVNESKLLQLEHNERLEFLGDAILDLIVSEYLYYKFPNLPEGELTKIKAQVVCEFTLAKQSSKIGIGDYLLLGKGESTSGGHKRISILADAFEALVGAIYISSDLASTAKFVLKKLYIDLNILSCGRLIKGDYKTMLQEFVQREDGQKICYEVLAEYGPDHDKIFKIAVLINNRRLGIGSGKKKKEAEQNAANEALINLKHKNRGK